MTSTTSRVSQATQHFSFKFVSLSETLSLSLSSSASSSPCASLSFYLQLNLHKATRRNKNAARCFKKNKSSKTKVMPAFLECLFVIVYRCLFLCPSLSLSLSHSSSHINLSISGFHWVQIAGSWHPEMEAIGARGLGQLTLFGAQHKSA